MGRKTLKIQQEMANKMQEYTKTLQGYRGKKCTANNGSTLNYMWKDIIIENEHLWVRNISQYVRKNKSEQNYVVDFFRFMFAKFKYPSFFNSAIINFSYSGNDNMYNTTRKSLIAKELKVFFYIASGRSLYKEIFKRVGFTKKETVEFINCPSSITSFSRAVLFCIIKSVISDNTTAKQFVDIFSSRIDSEFLDNCLLNVINFVIRNPSFKRTPSLEQIMLEQKLGHRLSNDTEVFHPKFKFIKNMIYFLCKYDVSQVKDCFIEIFDYFYNNNYEFSFKDRTLNSVIQLSNRWHHEQIVLNKGFVKNKEWDLLFPTNNDTIYRGWEIKELCTSNQILQEGARMNHCVASYVSSCMEGLCHIFTAFNLMENERATIEVRGKRVVQVRGKFNTQPSKNCMRAISDWATRHQLSKSGTIKW